MLEVLSDLNTPEYKINGHVLLADILLDKWFQLFPDEGMVISSGQQA